MIASVSLFIGILSCVVYQTHAYLHHNFVITSSSSTVSNTKLNENFNLDFNNPNIESSKEIFTEKQLREYTAQYSVDDRSGPLDFIFNLFKKKDVDNDEISSTVKNKKNSIEGKLKKTVSISVLEEKTAAYLKGKIDAKSFNTVLVAAFGDNLSVVLPEILASLPVDKAAKLTQVKK
jgi:hypothetical protein